MVGHSNACLQASIDSRMPIGRRRAIQYESRSKLARVSEPTYRWVVAGKVQGVGFRVFTRRVALGLGLHGSVRNLEDGRVEVLVTGRDVDIAALRAQLVSGPRGAEVASIDETAVVGARHSSAFELRF